MSTPSGAPAPRSHHLSEASLRGLCALTVLTSLLLLVTFDYGRDQSIYALVGRVLLEGGMPYRDAWDFKPPGVFLIYALARAIFGSAAWGIRVLEAMGLLASSWGLLLLAKRWWNDPRAGWLAAGLGALAHVQLDFWHTAQPESFGGMLTIAALVWASRGSAGSLVGAGALLGFTGLLKPPLAGGALVLALALSWRAWREEGGAPLPKGEDPARRPRESWGWSHLLRPPALVLGGAALPLVACALWFFARGALRDLYEVLFVFTPHYSKLSWEGESVPGMLYFGFKEWLVGYSAPLSLGVLALLALGRRQHERWSVGLLFAIIGVHLLGVVMQAKFFAYHYGATWPLTALLAGLGFSKLWARLETWGPAGAAAFLVALGCSVPLQTASKFVPGTFFERSAQRLALVRQPRGERRTRGFDDLATVADVNAHENRAAALFLQEHVGPGEPVFIYGFEPIVYDLAGRPLASRFIYDVPQRVAWSAEPMRARLMADLAAHPPRAVVVEKADVFPWVTGNDRDSATDLQQFPQLQELLQREFEPQASFGDLQVFLRR